MLRYHCAQDSPERGTGTGEPVSSAGSDWSKAGEPEDA